jgi:hypothetical protein
MRHVSFAWTTPALLARVKTVTRREWSDDYARLFKSGDTLAAYDKSPRAGGKQVATIRLTAAPIYEPLAAMPDDDYHAEGFGYLHAHPAVLPKTLFGKPCRREDFGRLGFEMWRQSGGSMWVIRFTVEDLTEYGIERLIEQTRRNTEAAAVRVATGVLL